MARLLLFRHQSRFSCPDGDGIRYKIMFFSKPVRAEKVVLATPLHDLSCVRLNWPCGRENGLGPEKVERTEYRFCYHAVGTLAEFFSIEF